MSIGLPRGRLENKRMIVCSRCGQVWNIDTKCDTRYGYLCPNCRRKKGVEKKHGNEFEKYRNDAGQICSKRSCWKESGVSAPNGVKPYEERTGCQDRKIQPENGETCSERSEKRNDSGVLPAHIFGEYQRRSGVLPI